MTVRPYTTIEPTSWSTCKMVEDRLRSSNKTVKIDETFEAAVFWKIVDGEVWRKSVITVQIGEITECIPFVFPRLAAMPISCSTAYLCWASPRTSYCSSTFGNMVSYSCLSAWISLFSGAKYGPRTFTLPLPTHWFRRTHTYDVLSIDMTSTTFC